LIKPVTSAGCHRYNGVAMKPWDDAVERLCDAKGCIGIAGQVESTDARRACSTMVLTTTVGIVRAC
jgi:hypothetical protein